MTKGKWYLIESETMALELPTGILVRVHAEAYGLTVSMAFIPGVRLSPDADKKDWAVIVTGDRDTAEKIAAMEGAR